MVIDDFLGRYEREYDYYLKVARLCQQQCETLLAQKGIKAIVTSRAKRHDRLAEKVKHRATEKRYKSVSDIYTDIVDLAGVRIALYFPGNSLEVDKLIKDAFMIREPPKKYPQPPKEEEQRLQYEKRFTGYHAIHYRVYLKKENAIDERYTNSCIEIQVASVLMHAWAEVEHDLLYKPLSGKISIGEHAILDEINGLVITGNIALERLQIAQEERLGRDDTIFKDQYELAIFLHYHYRTKVSNPNMIIGRADLLFRFLELADLNSPRKLREYTSKLDDSEDEDQRVKISDRLLDIILASEPKRFYEVFEKVVLTVDAQRSNSSLEEALGFFLMHWIDFERELKGILEKNNIKYQPGNVYLQAQKSMPFFGKNLENFQEFDRLRRLRNNVVHGAEIPDIETLNQAAQALTSLLKKLLDSEHDFHPF